MTDRTVRVYIALAILFTLLLAAGLGAQHRWDAQCAAEQPGTHWNGDDWMCQ